jgi:hypothetical protein
MWFTQKCFSSEYTNWNHGTLSEKLTIKDGRIRDNIKIFLRKITCEDERWRLLVLILVSQWSRSLRHEPSPPLERLDRGFECHSRHGCLCAFILRLFCCVCSWLPCDGLIPRPRSHNECVYIKRLKKRGQDSKGCRAVYRDITAVES